MTRVQSPSSINLYRQCPRRYYYRYIEKLPVSSNQYALIGNIVHEILETFFKEANLNDIDKDNYFLYFNFLINRLKDSIFESKSSKFKDLNFSFEEIKVFKKDIDSMITNWIEQFNKRIKLQCDYGKSLDWSFNYLKPKTEVLLSSDKHLVRGFVDAIFERDSGDIIIDYKTSKKYEMTEDYLIQLGIYALLYKELRGKLPKKVGIDFLKHSKIKFLNVTDDLIQRALLECELIKANTKTTDIIDYPKKLSPLCKWANGQCDFYEVCFNKKVN